MSRFRWMLPLVVVLAANLPLHVASAQERPPKTGLDGMPLEYPIVLMVTGSPLGARESTGQQDPEVAVLEFAWSAINEQVHLDGPEPGKYIARFRRYSPTRGGGVLAMLTVTSQDNRPPEELKKFAAMVEKRFEETLLVLHKANMDSLNERVRRAEDRLAQARANAEKRQTELQSLRTRLIQFDASPEGIDQQQNTLRQDRLKLRVELVGLKARREAIVKAIQEATDKLKAVSDEQQRELAELQKIVEIRGQAVSRAQQLYKTAAVSLSDVQQTEMELSRARADLAERRRVIAQQAGSDQHSRLNQQLADVQIEMAAAEARVAGIDDILDRLQSKDVLELLREYGRTTQQLEYARAEEKAAFGQLAEVKKTAESAAPPKVVEIRGPQAPK